jgi:spore germination cell wall hydrolase CwlJ-like protein
MNARLAGGFLLALLASGSALADHDPAHCLAMAIYWEAKTCGRDDMAAVGHVVLNRMADEQFPDDVCAVVKQGGEQPPCQFSWWCDGEADQPEDGEDWRLARDVAAELLAEPGADPTGSARFFHSTDIETPWAVERQRTATIGCHVFYR